MSRTTACFPDRRTAGRALAEAVEALSPARPVVLAVPCGGVLAAAPVAARLGCRLHPLLVRRLAVPADPAVGFGAVSADGVAVLDDALVRGLNLSSEELDTVAGGTLAVLRRWRTLFGPFLHGALADRDVVLIDDVMIGGHSMQAAADAVRDAGAATVTAAVPVATAAAANRLEASVDRLICLITESLPDLRPESCFPDEPEPGEQEVLRTLRRVAAL